MHATDSSGVLSPAVRRTKHGLLIDRETTFPDRCVKCGTAWHLTVRSEKFRVQPRVAQFVLLVLLLGTIIFPSNDYVQYALWALLLFGFVFLRKMNLSLPICWRCEKRWNAAEVAFAALFGGLLIALVFVGPRVGLHLRSPASMFIGAGALLTILHVFERYYQRPRTVRAQSIRGTTITLAGLHPDVEAELLADTAR